MTIVALACPGTADDAPSPLHARLASAGVNVVHAPMPVPAAYLRDRDGDVDLLALDIGTPLADPELGRQVHELLDARDRMLNGK